MKLSLRCVKFAVHNGCGARVLTQLVNQVGNEFSSVEALWSTFENVMAKEPEQPAKPETEAEGTNPEQNVKSEEAER